MKNMVMTAMVLAVLGGGGCGEDKSPAEKCEDLVSLICDRAVECIAGAAGMHSACVQAFEQEASCASTRSVSASYDRCLDRLDAVSCQALVTTDPATGETMLEVPTECHGVLSTQSALGGPGRVSTVPGGMVARARVIFASPSR
jgi:hypothetical protein